MRNHVTTDLLGIAKENLRNLNKQEQDKLELVRYYQELFAWPSKKKLSKIVEENGVKMRKKTVMI